MRNMHWAKPDLRSALGGRPITPQTLTLEGHIFQDSYIVKKDFKFFTLFLKSNLVM